ncbi:unnamed protein product [Lampetra fluviatilis]
MTNPEGAPTGGCWTRDTSPREWSPRSHRGGCAWPPALEVTLIPQPVTRPGPHVCSAEAGVYIAPPERQLWPHPAGFHGRVPGIEHSGRKQGLADRAKCETHKPTRLRSCLEIAVQQVGS